MADFKTLKSQVSIKQVADMLGLTLRADRENFRGPCPICKEGDTRTFKLYTATNTFWCHTHKKSGDIIGLVAAVLKCDPQAAGQKIADHFDIHAPRKSEQGPKRFDPNEWGKCLDPNHEALAPLGIKAETYKAFGAGYNASKPSLKGMLCIPMREAGGTPRGFLGVNLETQELAYPNGVDPEPLFNSDRVTPGTLHVVSHPLDVLRQIDTGIDELANVVAILVPTTPEVLQNLAALAQERGVESIEFHG